MGNLRDLVEGRRTTAAVGDHGGGEGPRTGMAMSGGGEITIPIRVIRPAVPIAPDANFGVLACPALDEDE